MRCPNIQACARLARGWAHGLVDHGAELVVRDDSGVLSVVLAKRCHREQLRWFGSGGGRVDLEGSEGPHL